MGLSSVSTALYKQ